MASPERTAYPRFRKLIPERELREFFTPSAEDAVWARERTRDRPGRVLALLVMLVMLKSAARLGRVPKVGETPEVVVAHLRDQAGLAAGTVPEADSGRSEERCPSAVRERLGLRHKPGEARAVTEAAMWVAAPVKAHTADLVNVALEELVRHKGRLEMPAFSTLDRMASRVRSGVEASQYKAIVARMSDAARERVVSMLEVVQDEYQSLFAWIKQPARRATWSRFRAHAERTERVDGLGDAVFWVGKTPPAKVAAAVFSASAPSGTNGFPEPHPADVDARRSGHRPARRWLPRRRIPAAPASGAFRGTSRPAACKRSPWGRPSRGRVRSRPIIPLARSHKPGGRLPCSASKRRRRSPSWSGRVGRGAAA
ncbi:DUF4158 domain-containing protein [Streptomyces europaeiscabiei]|uniref:DUF4158 domain-containing protein n=1 Tax=Streptomyces europaeiscabiei TaxID=146819 RepID=UPI003CC7F19F